MREFGKIYPTLTEEDKEILQAVIEEFGSKSKDFIVQTMHKERAYIETASRDIIQYKYATEANKDGFSSRHISSCCRGNRKTHKGYKWYYADEYYRGEK
jgi:hypothetical protein